MHGAAPQNLSVLPLTAQTDDPTLSGVKADWSDVATWPTYHAECALFHGASLASLYAVACNGLAPIDELETPAPDANAATVRPAKAH